MGHEPNDHRRSLSGCADWPGRWRPHRWADPHGFAPCRKSAQLWGFNGGGGDVCWATRSRAALKHRERRRALALRRSWENVNGYCIGHDRFHRPRHADGRSRWFRTRIVRRRKVQEYAHRRVPQEASRFVCGSVDDVNRSAIVHGDAPCVRKSGSHRAVLPFLLSLVDGGDCAAHGLEISERFGDQTESVPSASAGCWARCCRWAAWVPCC